MTTPKIITPVSVEIQLRARLEVLYEAIEGLARGLGAEFCTSYILNTIRKGVLEEKLLESITIYYIVSDGTMIGFAEIAIDWDSYEASISTSEGAMLKIAKNRSLLEQISELFPTLILHADHMCRAFDVKERRFAYSYRREVREDPTRLASARKVLNTSPSEPVKWSTQRNQESNKQKEDLLILTQRSDVLRELGVTIQSLRSPSGKTKS